MYHFIDDIKLVRTLHIRYIIYLVSYKRLKEEIHILCKLNKIFLNLMLSFNHASKFSLKS